MDEFEKRKRRQKLKTGKRQLNLQATVDSMFDKKTPMKKQRLEDSVKDKDIEVIGRQGQKLSKGGRAGLKGGGICKKGMNRKAIGKNS